MRYKLTFLYDGDCPLCRRETNFIKRKDFNKTILFVDITSKDFIPEKFQNISYLEAMNNLHGILDNGKVIKGLDVLANAYELVGLGWIYSPLRIPLFSNLLRFIYKYWAKNRLSITGRSNSEILCSDKCIEFK
tara:strand:- start:2050 stop:2448 length:399 start_codon:yes stop_codon:yes gene_type:complete